jgi:hypothetical protein
MAEISAVEALIVKQTNRFRKGEGLEPVEPNTALNKTSQRFADFMARTKKFGHTADGRLPSERAQAQGYQFCIVSENIAYQFRSEGFSTEELARGFRHGMGKVPGAPQEYGEPRCRGNRCGCCARPVVRGVFCRADVRAPRSPWGFASSWPMSQIKRFIICFQTEKAAKNIPSRRR